VPRRELDASVAELAAKFRSKLPEALRYTKAQLNWWRDLVWSQTITHARDWLAVHSTADETREAVAAFHEKRPPRYDELRLDAGLPADLRTLRRIGPAGRAWLLRCVRRSTVQRVGHGSAGAGAVSVPGVAASVPGVAASVPEAAADAKLSDAHQVSRGPNFRVVSSSETVQIYAPRLSVGVSCSPAQHLATAAATATVTSPARSPGRGRGPARLSNVRLVSTERGLHRHLAATSVQIYAPRRSAGRRRSPAQHLTISRGLVDR